MKDREVPKANENVGAKKKIPASSQVIAADAAKADEVPTIPLDSLQTLSTLKPEIAVRSVTTTQTATVLAPLVIQPAEYRRGVSEWLQIWWDGLRPYYLPFAILPMILGSVLAWLASISAKHPGGEFHPQRFFCALIAVILLQLGANLLNDYYDYLGGIDTSNSLGPGGLIQTGVVQPARVLSIGLCLLFTGAFLGALVAFYGGLIAFGFGLLGLLGAYFYSSPRHSLASLTLGEITSFWLFGPILTLGAYVIQRGKIDLLPLVCSISLGLFLSAVLYLNDIRDIESDDQAHKHTLATLLSLRSNRLICSLLLLCSYVPILVLGLPSQGAHLILITLWTLPGMSGILLNFYRSSTPASLHMTMRQTLKLAIFFTILLVIALTITAYWQGLPNLALPGLPFVF